MKTAHKALFAITTAAVVGVATFEFFRRKGKD